MDGKRRRLRPEVDGNFRGMDRSPPDDAIRLYVRDRTEVLEIRRGEARARLTCPNQFARPRNLFR